jgi:hypothetical protein
VVSAKDARQRLVIGGGQVARVDQRRRHALRWQAELSRCNVDFGPSLAARNLRPPVGGEQGPGGGHEDREDSNDRDGKGVHEDQGAPCCNQPSEWSNDIEPQGGRKRGQSAGAQLWSSREQRDKACVVPMEPIAVSHVKRPPRAESLAAWRHCSLVA